MEKESEYLVGRLVELNHTGDSSIVFDTVATLATAVGVFAGYMIRGCMMFEVGERHPEGVMECPKCTSNAPLSNEDGRAVKALDARACTVVATPRTAGG